MTLLRNGLGTQVLWVALAEKAYAVANSLGYVTTSNEDQGSYSALNGGYPSWALPAITGNPASNYNINPTNIASDWKAGDLIVLSPIRRRSSHIIGDHCYAVVGYNATSSKPFELFNPWGTDSSGLVPGIQSILWPVPGRTQRLSRITSWGRTLAKGSSTLYRYSRQQTTILDIDDPSINNLRVPRGRRLGRWGLGGGCQTQDNSRRYQIQEAVMNRTALLAALAVMLASSPSFAQPGGMGGMGGGMGGMGGGMGGMGGQAMTPGMMMQGGRVAGACFTEVHDPPRSKWRAANTSSGKIDLRPVVVDGDLGQYVITPYKIKTIRFLKPVDEVKPASTRPEGNNNREGDGGDEAVVVREVAQNRAAVTAVGRGGGGMQEASEGGADSDYAGSR